MPIVLQDAEVYNVRYEDIYYNDMVLFFLGEHKDDVISLYDMKGGYRGCVTYTSFLRGTDIAGSIIDEKLFAGDKLFKNAQDILDGKRDQMIPVFNNRMEMLYFAKYEYKLQKPWNQLLELRSHVNAGLWRKFRDSDKHFHIVYMSDVSYDLRIWLLAMGAKVTVEGEEWEIFGIEEEICKDKDAIIIDEEYKQLNILHEEYRSWIKDDIKELEQMILKPYIESTTGNDQILFYMPIYPYFLDSISPLIFKYLRSGKKCIITFPHFERIIALGRENMRKLIMAMKRLESEGGKICSIRNSGGEYLGKYQICFFVSEYSGKVPVSLRENSEYVVTLQTAALYTHMYGNDWEFGDVFSDKEREKIDFLIASSFTADWICKQDERWDKKILRFGYPKLDTLYHSLMGDVVVPKEWEERINGRKVFLFTEIEEVWLDILQKNGWVAIWRPHPLSLEKNADKIKSLCKKYENIIIDDMLSYYTSFKVADALISIGNIGSLMVNFLFTGKQVCFYEYESRQMNERYRQESWYKSVYVASGIEEVEAFIQSIGRGEKIDKQEQEENRKFVMKEFDGKVCDRIYDFFEHVIMKKEGCN